MWPAYLINLADNTERLDRSKAQFDAQGIAFSRIDGVNGWAMSEDELSRVHDAEGNARIARHPLVPAEIGCYLSHIDAWRAIAEGDAPGGFIFEDDFAAEGFLAETLALLTADAEEGGAWDMVKLFAFDPDARLLDPRPLGRFTIGIPYRVPTCLIGYGLTRAAARRLSEGALPIRRPVDEDQKFFWETGLRVALITPPPILVGDQQAATGTIGETRRKAARNGGFPARRGRLAQAWRSLRYQINYTLRLHWHRLKGTGR
ncbi:glycosyl transferase family 25 [Brevirhabdus pacifica]|uniref:Glycosyl transferase family 25 n=1 Tax=Brevirhabdus pacifica TaxID=1267768 RepID=A0A1U7DMJ2_9RHOB|nr:glycosyltransferase family 25 protein [Brevirhabdus pacifica]APX91088.1 glycosyl transferase family 25 [Brevirhabdus pacifica]PJJ82792.1 glycosyl transferase family 25 [Brevirhabdus pacifica]